MFDSRAARQTMYELKRTHARALFKDLLGQANHFLITILIGLKAVQNGTATLEEEFRTSWNPRDVKQSAERSRQFTLDLALIRAVDALDAYFIRTRRSPVALNGTEFKSAMDGARQSVSRRVDIFNEYLDPLPVHRRLFLKLAIDWRNRRVHSLAQDTLTATETEELLSHAAILGEDHNGLVVPEMVAHYRQGLAPSFKEAASVIRLAQNTVRHFDTQLVARLAIDDYVLGLLRLVFDPLGRISDADLRHACVKTWGSDRKREQKVQRLLRMAGVHSTDEIVGRQVPEPLVEKIVAMDPEEAFQCLKRYTVSDAESPES